MGTGTGINHILTMPVWLREKRFMKNFCVLVSVLRMMAHIIPMVSMTFSTLWTATCWLAVMAIYILSTPLFIFAIRAVTKHTGAYRPGSAQRKERFQERNFSFFLLVSNNLRIFALEHRLMVLMGHLPAGCFVMAMMASAEARRCDF